MNSNEVRNKFLNFFEKKNHKIVNKLNLDLDCSTKNANLYLKEILIAMCLKKTNLF